ncbi:hypothetical protein Lser_V15G35015 [Lactuca serriola]
MFSFQSFATFTSITTRTLPNSTSDRRYNSYPKQIHRLQISCNVAPDDKEKLVVVPETQKLILPKSSLDTLNVDRRNMLLGLGGLYTTVNFTSPAAFAAPITTPNVSTCVTSNLGFQDPNKAVRSRACCPPAPATSTAPKDFVFPKDQVIRIRPAAHRTTTEYVAKYKAAIQAMRDLPDEHPHSFVAQAKIHCAYCNGGYTQIASGFPDKELQIHNSWLFFPFHRWYLYFYERILGKLIDDPTFALPYWNWDHPNGMTFPAFLEDDSAFDAYRNRKHLPPALVDLNYSGSDRHATCIRQITSNMTLMYKQMISNAGDTTSFFGSEYRAGNDAYRNGDPSVGSIEAGCHTAVHRWMGDPGMPNNEDMGNFYSAGYDPAFYIHHANVDRMWKLWKDMGIKGHSEPTHLDWRNASYVFYDENQQLVRVYNKDCVSLEKLKYEYEYSPPLWKISRSSIRRTLPEPIPYNMKSAETVKQLPDVKFPLKLDKITKVVVKRPAKSRSQEDKEKANELLLIKGIKFNSDKFIKFDVFVNAQDDVSESFEEESEFAGSFAQLPHNHGDDMLMKSGIRFGLTELLEEMEAEDDEFILVTLVPKVWFEEVTIDEIKVELVPII